MFNIFLSFRYYIIVSKVYILYSWPRKSIRYYILIIIKYNNIVNNLVIKYDSYIYHFIVLIKYYLT